MKTIQIDLIKSQLWVMLMKWPEEQASKLVRCKETESTFKYHSSNINLHQDPIVLRLS